MDNYKIASKLIFVHNYCVQNYYYKVLIFFFNFLLSLIDGSREKGSNNQGLAAFKLRYGSRDTFKDLSIAIMFYTHRKRTKHTRRRCQLARWLPCTVRIVHLCSTRQNPSLAYLSMPERPTRAPACNVQSLDTSPAGEHMGVTD